MPSAVRLREDYSAEELPGRWPGGRRRQPEPAVSVAGCGRRWNGPRLMAAKCAARTAGRCVTAGASVQRLAVGGPPHRPAVPGSPASPFDRWRWHGSRRSSRPADREKDGVVRWRRIDLKRVISPRGSGVEFHPRYVGKLAQKLGFSHISARPRHPAQDERIVEAFKKTFRAR